MGFRVLKGVRSTLRSIPSRKLTWKPKKGPIKTTVLLKGGYMGFHVSLGECRWDMFDQLHTCRKLAVPISMTNQ